MQKRFNIRSDRWKDSLLDLYLLLQYNEGQFSIYLLKQFILLIGYSLISQILDLETALGTSFAIS